jgi:hypothetical protein
MPFGANGTFTPPTGATNATVGAVIKSATWNSINADYSLALTQLGQGTFLATPRTISSGSFTLAVADTAVLVQGNSPTISLPLSSTKTGVCWIMGAAGTVFGSNNAKLITTSPDTINGVGTITATSNFQVLFLYPLPSGGYIAKT